MTAKEMVLTEIEMMQENEMLKLLPFIGLLRHGVNIHSVAYGRPVVKESELSKLDLN